jgi:hypothetical protein
LPFGFWAFAFAASLCLLPVFVFAPETGSDFCLLPGFCVCAWVSLS